MIPPFIAMKSDRNYFRKKFLFKSFIAYYDFVFDKLNFILKNYYVFEERVGMMKEHRIP